MNCLKINTVKDLEEVSRICKNSTYCKSKMMKNGNFTVKTFLDNDKCHKNDPRTVWIKSSTDKDKLNNLDDLLDESGFYNVVKKKCKGKKSCKIVVKANINSAMQVKHKQYTDPELVDRIVDNLNDKGYKNVDIVEAQSSIVWAFPKHLPNLIAKKIGYKHDVKDLTKDKRLTINYKGGKTELSKKMVEADMIIDVPKIKNHQIQYLTGALKNMYGSLPVIDKYGQFHHQDSGLNVENATVLVNHATPVDFVVGDMIHSIDGHESVFQTIEITDYFESNLLFAGQDPLTIDKVAESKMGYDENQSPVIKQVVKFRGNIPIKDIPIIGGDLSKIKGWKKETAIYTTLNQGRDGFSKVMKKFGFGEIISMGMKLGKFDVH